MKSKFIMNMQARIFNKLPKGIRQLSLMRFVFPFLHWKVHPKGYKHASAILSNYKNKYRGCRCVILGNGPSLQKMNLNPLIDEFTFGLNRIYLLFDKLGFETTFLVAVNRTVLNQFGREIINTSSLKVLNWMHRYTSDPDKKTAYINVNPWKKLNGDILEGYYRGIGTVTNVAIEVAFFMGFSEVILIGVDHSYKEKGVPGLTVVSNNNDQNHFSPDYFGKGIIWQLPDLVASEKCYKEAKELFESNGRRIIDATKNGNLTIFPKEKFENVLESSQFKNKSNHKS